ncbi:MAG: peptidyl-prolyl cis-trans isomerase [Candidatus Sumerlaeota bacterium]|nr:peptidyl-prolyl cis-trans isomerase [Candidatus Sumerlaeota bacterium]
MQSRHDVDHLGREAEPFDSFASRFRFSPKRLESALNIGVRLCRAVERLHHDGQAHGSLKNESVAFGKDGSPIIADPDPVPDRSKRPDPREDVRALGLLLCRLYTAKPALVINDYTLMTLAKAKVPRQLLRVLWQAIHEESSMRFADAATLGRALREVPLPEYQRTVQVRALPDNVGPSNGMPKWLRNAAIFVVTVGIIAAGAWMMGWVTPTGPTLSSSHASVPTAAPSPRSTSQASSAPPAAPNPAHMRPRFTLETNFGRVEIEANAEAAPMATFNFAQLVDGGFYDGVAFSRVVPNFVIQAGQFDMAGNRKESPFPPVRNEWLNSMEAVAGTVGMGRLANDPDSISTAFFINLRDNRQVFGSRQDGAGEAIFGTVTGGMDVVRNISNSPTRNPGGGDHWPQPPVYITAAYFTTGQDANAIMETLRSLQPQKKVLENGVVIEDVVQGRGREFDPSMAALMHFTRKTASGGSAGSSRAYGSPILVQPGDLSPLLTSGLLGMRAGGRRIITPQPLPAGVSPEQSTPPIGMSFDFQLVSQQAASSAAVNDIRTISVHYYRTDGDYAQVGLWVWNPVALASIPAREIFPSGRTQSGVTFTINTEEWGVSDFFDVIGLIPRLRSDWERKDGGDKFWHRSLGAEVWIVQGDERIYTSRPPSFASQ